MNKDTFIDLINALEKQYKYDELFSLRMHEFFDVGNFYLQYNNSVLRDAIIDALQTEMNDLPGSYKGQAYPSTIEYYIYELDFGKKYKRGCLLINDKPIDISNPERLYEFLKQQKYEKRQQR